MDSGHPDSLRRLKVNLLDLEIAFDTGSFDMTYYLDQETGEVILINSEARRAVEDVEDDEASSASGLPQWMEPMVEAAKLIYADEAGRYIEIPQQESNESYEDMQDFIGTVTIESLRERLWDAIQGRGAIRRFKDILSRYPEERQRWFNFEQECTRQRIVDWLAAEGIEPVNADDAPAVRQRTDDDSDVD